MNRGAVSGAFFTASQPVTLRIDAEDSDTELADDYRFHRMGIIGIA